MVPTPRPPCIGNVVIGNSSGILLEIIDFGPGLPAGNSVVIENSSGIPGRQIAK